MANKFTNAARTTLATDVNAIVYTSPSLTESVVHSIYVDIATGTGTFTLTLNGTIPFASNIIVNAGSPVIFNKPINMNAGDSITITTTTANINILTSILEIS